MTRLTQFRRWLARLERDGKTQHLRELEMWLKSFDRYFVVSNLPLSDEDQRHATLRDYSEELNAVSDVIFRISQLCTYILSEEQVSYASFAKYVENSLKEIYILDGYRRRKSRGRNPRVQLNDLMESLLDVRTTILEMDGLSKISYLCFTSIGRILLRALERDVFLDFFLQKKFIPLFDRVMNPEIVRVVKSIQVPEHRKMLASLFLEFFRILRYLHYVNLQMQDASALKRSLLIFSLVHAELKFLIQYIEEKFLRREFPDRLFAEMMEAVAYSLTMEVKKVMQKELLGVAPLQQYELIFTRIENSQGILRNAVQQIVCTIAQYFDSALQGDAIFPDYVTRLEQSKKLLADLNELRDYVKAFSVQGDLPQVSALIKKIEWFKAKSMRHLMYKDWSEVDGFYAEICACKTAGNLNFVLHRFETFLSMLGKEVNKRSILQKDARL